MFLFCHLWFWSVSLLCWLKKSLRAEMWRRRCLCYIRIWENRFAIGSALGRDWLRLDFSLFKINLCLLSWGKKLFGSICARYRSKYNYTHLTLACLIRFDVSDKWHPFSCVFNFLLDFLWSMYAFLYGKETTQKILLFCSMDQVIRV